MSDQTARSKKWNGAARAAAAAAIAATPAVVAETAQAGTFPAIDNNALGTYEVPLGQSVGIDVNGDQLDDFNFVVADEGFGYGVNLFIQGIDNGPESNGAFVGLRAFLTGIIEFDSEQDVYDAAFAAELPDVAGEGDNALLYDEVEYTNFGTASWLGLLFEIPGQGQYVSALNVETFSVVDFGRGDTSLGSFTINQGSFAFVPTPSAAALFGFAGFAALRRRR
jgi:hypothetical protein